SPRATCKYMPVSATLGRAFALPGQDHPRRSRRVGPALVLGRGDPTVARDHVGRCPEAPVLGRQAGGEVGVVLARHVHDALAVAAAVVRLLPPGRAPELPGLAHFVADDLRACDDPHQSTNLFVLRSTITVVKLAAVISDDY